MSIEKKLPKNFNAKAYLDLNPDVANDGLDPKFHYLNYGINEGRKYNYISTVLIQRKPHNLCLINSIKVFKNYFLFMYGIKEIHAYLLILLINKIIISKLTIIFCSTIFS